MTAQQLGRELGVSKQAVLQLEASERAGTISLASLRRAAQKLDCELVVVLVPNSTLEERVKSQARRTAARRLARVSHSMRLEAQETSAEVAEDRVRELADELTAKSPSRIWDPA